jgi:hypothetical protein
MRGAILPRPYTYFYLFICGLFNKTLGVLGDIASSGRTIVNDELKKMLKETIVA